MKIMIGGLLALFALFASAPAFSARTPELDAILSFDSAPDKPERGAGPPDDADDEDFTPSPGAKARGLFPEFQSGAKTAPHLPYHGNTKTLKYHNQFCDHYDCRTCTKVFRTKEAAQKAGYVPCGKCWR